MGYQEDTAAAVVFQVSHLLEGNEIDEELFKMKVAKPCTGTYIWWTLNCVIWEEMPINGHLASLGN